MILKRIFLSFFAGCFLAGAVEIPKKIPASTGDQKKAKKNRPLKTKNLLPQKKAGKKGKRHVSSSEKPPPLVLQWEVSHSRNTDQISLIFRKTHVELVVNTTSYQKTPPPRLGRFVSDLNPRLQSLKAEVLSHYLKRKESVPLSELVKPEGLLSAPHRVPHEVVLRINEKEIYGADSDFQTLSRLIHQVWEHPWKCERCASYQKQKNSILRVVRKNQQRGTEEEKKVFSKKNMNCIRKGEDRMECMDTSFGIFEL